LTLESKSSAGEEFVVIDPVSAIGPHHKLNRLGLV
jgi:hypothetical protein